LVPALPTRSGRCGLATVVLLATAGLAAARIVGPDDSPADQARVVLAGIAAAFEQGDYEALAAVLHPDGVRIGLSPEFERTNELTPAQAYYYFKNLFQVRRTVRFEVQKRQVTAEGRLLVVAAWQCERTDSGRAEARRLLITLVHGAADWSVTEITDLRGG